MNSSDKTAANRRRLPRRPPLRGVTVVCRKGNLGLGADLALRLLDLSESGARLRAREELGKGQEVTLALDSPRQSRPVEVVGTVLWCVPAEDASWVVGVTLAKPLPYQVLSLLTRL